MKKFLLVLSCLLVIGGGCSSLKKNSDEGYWIPYANETEGYTIPHLSSWYVQEFQVPAGLGYSLTGFSPEQITHTQPAKTGNGKVVIQLLAGPYAQSLIDANKGKAGFTQKETTINGVPAAKMAVEGENGGVQLMMVLQHGKKTMIVASEELLTEEDIDIFDKMVEGLSLHQE
jgi:hypothetical protein